MFQCGAAGVQCADGLHLCVAAHVELWRAGHDVYPLEGPSAAAAGLSHHHLRPHVPRLHQVPARLDTLGCPRSHGRLG